VARVNVILDEAASLGPNMGCIEDAIDKYRGYGIRLQLYYQSPSQLKKCFPKDQDQTVLANVTQVYFGINDTSAEYVSNRLGDQTVVVDSGGTSSGYSSQSSGGGAQKSSTESTNRNRNWNQMARRLLKPEEILAMSERIAITFVPGMRPIRTTLERYYETKKSRNGFSRSDAIVFASYILLVMTACALEAMKLLKGLEHV